MDGFPEVLSRQDCLRLLTTVPVGRVVYTQHALPAVAPVGFVLDGTELLLRLPEGNELAAAVRRSVVAFQADDVDPVTQGGWTVTVTGWAREETDQAQLRRLAALPLRPWIAGGREHFIKITTDLVSGSRLGPRVPA
ncbi:MAG: hypothetical protein JWN35_1785 [Frankiales bacterium]|jgi:hypothetical protein|nr:hypothetical protein [Frankiales bacterium]